MFPVTDQVEVLCEVLHEAGAALEEEIDDAWSRLTELRKRQRWVTGAYAECSDPAYLQRAVQADEARYAAEQAEEERDRWEWEKRQEVSAEIT